MKISEGIDLYEVLQILPDAEHKAIVKAYRKLAKKYHPDVNKNPGAAEKFREVVAAYKILRDPTERMLYDLELLTEQLVKGDSIIPSTPAKMTFWDEYYFTVNLLMKRWKREYFAEMATCYDNDLSILFPTNGAPELTIPNVICRGTLEHAAIWCEETGDSFVVGIFSLTVGRVALRRYVTPDILEQALIACARELRSGQKGTNNSRYGRDDVIQEILGGYKRRLANSKNGLFTEETLDALLYLAANGNTNPHFLYSLEQWVKTGAMEVNRFRFEDEQPQIYVTYFYEVCAAFTHLAESELKALEYLTNIIIKGWKDKIPHLQLDSLVDVFLAMNPKKALPETKGVMRAFYWTPKSV